jgi:hypothetical protein
VDEDVVAAVTGDEAVALLVAEPLDGAFRQRASLLSTPAASTPFAEACRPGRRGMYRDANLGTSAGQNPRIAW